MTLHLVGLQIRHIVDVVNVEKPVQGIKVVECGDVVQALKSVVLLSGQMVTWPNNFFNVFF